MKGLSSDLEVFRQTRSTVDLVCVETSKSLLNSFIYCGAKIAANQAFEILTDGSKHLNHLESVGAAARRCAGLVVEDGRVAGRVNRSRAQIADLTQSLGASRLGSCLLPAQRARRLLPETQLDDGHPAAPFRALTGAPTCVDGTSKWLWPLQQQ